jgi:hypothetical protein
MRKTILVPGGGISALVAASRLRKGLSQWWILMRGTLT